MNSPQFESLKRLEDCIVDDRSFARAHTDWIFKASLLDVDVGLSKGELESPGAEMRGGISGDWTTMYLARLGRKRGIRKLQTVSRVWRTVTAGGSSLSVVSCSTLAAHGGNPTPVLVQLLERRGWVYGVGHTRGLKGRTTVGRATHNNIEDRQNETNSWYSCGGATLASPPQAFCFRYCHHIKLAVRIQGTWVASTSEPVGVE